MLKVIYLPTYFLACDLYSFRYIGWKIAVEQQISTMKSEGFEIEKERKKSKPKKENLSIEESPFHQMLANMKEASFSIYEQYLSEKVCSLSVL